MKGSYNFFSRSIFQLKKFYKSQNFIFFNFFPFDFVEKNSCTNMKIFQFFEVVYFRVARTLYYHVLSPFLWRISWKLGGNNYFLFQMVIEKFMWGPRLLNNWLCQALITEIFFSWGLTIFLRKTIWFVWHIV